MNNPRVLKYSNPGGQASDRKKLPGADVAVRFGVSTHSRYESKAHRSARGFWRGIARHACID